MKRRALRTALGLCSAGTALAGAGAWAQEPVSAGAPPAAATAAYVDRVLEEGAVVPEAPQIEEPSTGWPRGWSAELQSNRQSSSAVKTQSQALTFSGFLDTPNYGAFSANLNLNRNPAPVYGYGVFGSSGSPSSVVPFTARNNSTWRIDQRAMPFDGGWFGNSAIGNINMASTPLARGVGRVFLPSLPIEGVSVSVEQPGRTQFNASAGRLGYFDGLAFEGFSAGRGTAASVGAQTQIAGGDGPLAIGRTDAAVQFVEARNVNTSGVTGYARDTRTLWGAVSWQGLAPWADALGRGTGGISDRVGGMRVQANLVHSAGRPSDATSQAASDAATGGWLDAAWRTDWLQQNASVFYFQPSLRWGSDTLPNNLRGASWRGDISTRQWQLGGNVELSDSVSGVQRRSLYANVFGRYRFDSRDAVSGNVAVRSGSYAAQSAQLTWEHQSDWGYTQWRTDAAHGVDLRVLRTGVDHAWRVGEAQTLSTSLAVEQANRSGASLRSVYWGVLGTTPFVAGARLDLSLRGSNGIGGNSARFLSANARLAWPLGSGWSFITQLTASRGQEALDPTVVSALTTATLQPTLIVPSTRSFMLVLRYEGRAGSASAPIGGAPGLGDGRLEGHVFFDQNNNGRREANEGGVGGVTVRIDRRYVTQTDAQGFYSFPSVAGGSHEVELVQDTLPLPWSSPGSSTQRVDIRVRGTAVSDFGVQKDR